MVEKMRSNLHSGTLFACASPLHSHAHETSREDIRTGSTSPQLHRLGALGGEPINALSSDPTRLALL